MEIYAAFMEMKKEQLGNYNQYLIKECIRKKIIEEIVGNIGITVW